MDENSALLEALACFGCMYGDDCLEEFESGYAQCDKMLENAKEFAVENKLLED